MVSPHGSTANRSAETMTRLVEQPENGPRRHDQTDRRQRFLGYAPIPDQFLWLHSTSGTEPFGKGVAACFAAAIAAGGKGGGVPDESPGADF